MPADASKLISLSLGVIILGAEMNKRRLKIIVGVVLALCLGAFALAASPIKLFVNGQEIVTEVTPKIVAGTVLAPLKAIAEAFGATVEWDEKTKSVSIEAKRIEADQAQVRLLEEALAPEDPLNAAQTWAEGVKARNGALQYAVMTPDLKKGYLAKFVDSNWSTGASSPWVENYEITERYNFNNEKYRFEINFTSTDSTKETFSTTEYVTVANFDGNWLVSSIEKVEAKGEITKITLGKDKKVKSIFVQGKPGAKGSYDQAEVLIDAQTKIFQGYTDQELTADDLKKGAAVEVAFTDGPRLMIYPVSAPARTIRVMNQQSAGTNVYRNTQFGFSFSLPESWNDYRIITEKWEGRALDSRANGKIVETGLVIKIRHPEWTSENPRQDIPIMVFTRNQWDALQQEEFHIGAAPMGPKELGRNSKYVFALPARYNYAFPTGYEEVERILEDNPLKPMEE